MMTVRQAGEALECGQATAVALARAALDRIADPAGQGPRAFMRVHAQEALAAARAADEERLRMGRRGSPLAGIPVSVKDLFDVAGETTRAGSRVRASEPAAAQDAVVVQRLRAAGAVIVGRTNMTEFAYSGLGLNPHYPVPLNPYDRVHGRIPGGSSSGAAVSVSDGMALAAVATDTGGSARIPAAFCGLTGFKPTAARIPLAGTFPLSPTLDTVGSLGATVECCAALDAVLAGETWQPLGQATKSPLRLGLVMDYVTDGMDAQVTRAYEQALSSLSHQGVRIEPVPLPELLELPGFNHKGGFPAYESYRDHADCLATRATEYDPRVAVRILRGRTMDDADYRQLQAQRAGFIQRVAHRFAGFDALIAPTVPIVAPLVSDCDDDAEFGRLNLLALRNPTVVNFLDGCAISLPCHPPGEAPVGLMLMQTAHQDRALLECAHAVERLLSFHLMGAAAR